MRHDSEGSTSPDPPIERPHLIRQKLIEARNGSAAAINDLLVVCREYLILVANQEVPGDLRPKMAASDLVQESLAEAWATFDQFQGHDEKSLLRWARAILYHNLQDAIRVFRGAAKRDIAREVSLTSESSYSAVAAQLVAADLSPSKCMVLADELLGLYAAIERLPPRHARVIRLRNLEYLSFEQVAVHFGVSEDAARKLWERALRRLNRELKGRGHDN